MSSNFWLFGVESRDSSQTKKERTAYKSGQIHKMVTTFTQLTTILNTNNCHFFLICSALQAVLFFSASEKSRDSTPNSQKLKKGEHFSTYILSLLKTLNLISITY